MTSVVAICNLALSNLGKLNISSIDEASAEARACRQFYEHTRDLLLESYPWRFAAKTTSMAQVSNDKPALWGYAYSRPVDCLKVRFVLRDPSVESCVVKANGVTTFVGEQYYLEASSIYCDISPAFLHYTAKVTDPTKFTPLFVDALAWHLAVRLAMPLTRDPKVRADAWQVAQQMTAAAQMMDANEKRHSSDVESEFVRARA